MNDRTTTLLTGVALLAATLSAAWAADEDARFGGGSYDGWHRHAMTEFTQVGVAAFSVSLSSGTDQTFDFTASPSLAALTILAEEPAGKMTNGGMIRVSVPTDWACRFDPGVSVSYAGDAAVKAGGARYTDGDRTLSIPVTGDFAAGDTLIVSGLRLVDLRLITPGAKRLELDADGDGARDKYDEYTVTVRALWPGGSYDGWHRHAMTEFQGLNPGTKGALFLVR